MLRIDLPKNFEIFPEPVDQWHKSAQIIEKEQFFENWINKKGKAKKKSKNNKVCFKFKKMNLLVHGLTRSLPTYYWSLHGIQNDFCRWLSIIAIGKRKWECERWIRSINWWVAQKSNHPVGRLWTVIQEGKIDTCAVSLVVGGSNLLKVTLSDTGSHTLTICNGFKRLWSSDFESVIKIFVRREKWMFIHISIDTARLCTTTINYICLSRSMLGIIYRLQLDHSNLRNNYITSVFREKCDFITKYHS